MTLRHGQAAVGREFKQSGNTQDALPSGLALDEAVRPLGSERKTLEVAITKAGAGILRAAQSALRREQDRLLKCFTPDELVQFAEFMERFARVFSRAQGPQ